LRMRVRSSWPFAHKKKPDSKESGFKALAT
jgi:hypothetical protein